MPNRMISLVGYLSFLVILSIDYFVLDLGLDMLDSAVAWETYLFESLNP